MKQTNEKDTVINSYFGTCRDCGDKKSVGGVTSKCWQCNYNKVPENQI